MNLGFRQIFTILAALLLPKIMPAQDLPLLPDDPAVVKGVMPNGMSYYLAANPTVKGTADFALVQKTGMLTAGDSAGTEVKAAARRALSSLKLISPSSPYDFLARHNVAPGKDGFVTVTDDATVFRFSDVKLSRADVLDSVLVVIMGMAGNVGDDFVTKWYTPADQAVIVSGDIDAKAVASKLVSMSYMIPQAVQTARPEYVRDEPDAVAVRSLEHGLSEVSATWTSKRVPREYMNTVQPEIFEMSLHTLGQVASGRLKKSLKSENVPAADISYGHVCSSSYPYDDSFSIKVITDSADVREAVDALAGVMSSIDEGGITVNEYVLAERSYLHELEHAALKPVKSDAEAVNRCRNAFLYNSSLASPRERLNFHTSRNLPDTMRQRLFNDVAKALVDMDVFPDSLLTEGKAEPAASMSVNVSDTLDFPGQSPKVKLRSTKREHVSGGSIWTFSNGFKVIYKRMKTDRMYYSLALNGGYSSMEGLDPGEGAFLSDYLKTCHVNGLKAEDFLNILGREGVSMDFAVSMSNTMIDGSLPKNRMQLLLRSLLALTNARTPDEEAFNYYIKSEYMALDLLQGSSAARAAAIDNIMCPDYKYSPFKQKGNVSADFQADAERFFDERFSRMNDGALILVGNIEEEKLKKMLMDYAGGFRTSDVAFKRPMVRYQPVSGWSTYTVEGAEDNVDVALSARMPLTMENFLASDLAAMVLKSRLASELDETGMHFTLTYNCRINPEERFNMLISVSEASGDGFHEGMERKTPIEALAYVRSALASLNHMEITAEELKPYKEAVKHTMAGEMESPEYWVHAIALRYLDGKDCTTNYAQKTDAVTPEKVMSVLRLLDAGSKVEYVTTKR